MSPKAEATTKYQEQDQDLNTKKSCQDQDYKNIKVDITG